MDIYAQIVPLAQIRALEQLSEFAKVAAVDSRSKTVQKDEFFKVTEMAEIVANPLKRLVELVGIEPTTSSLRTMRSPS